MMLTIAILDQSLNRISGSLDYHTHGAGFGRPLVQSRGYRQVKDLHATYE